MNRRSFLSAATLSLPIWAGCTRRGQPHGGTPSSASHPPPPPDSQRLIWNLGPRDAFVDQVSTAWAAKSRGAVFVVRKNQKLYAISSICTHLGCVLDLGGKGFACGCHGSQFALDGTRLSGPAKRPLLRYGIWVNDHDQVLIDKSITFDPDHADALGSFVFIY